jgi:hypothetical protein
LLSATAIFTYSPTDHQPMNPKALLSASALLACFTPQSIAPNTGSNTMIHHPGKN